MSLLLDYASKDNWGLPPVLPRRDFLTKEACGCRKEAKWSQSPVLPWTRRAYETCLSAGSTAFELRKWSPHPELHRAKTRVPGECIADNALGALKMVRAKGFAPLT